jgi:hypothetical protein
LLSAWDQLVCPPATVVQVTWLKTPILFFLGTSESTKNRDAQPVIAAFREVLLEANRNNQYCHPRLNYNYQETASRALIQDDARNTPNTRSHALLTGARLASSNPQ